MVSVMTQEVDIFFHVAVLVFSVVAHEVSHGYAALALGDRTALYAGRLTMNPIKHIDPIGSVLLPLLMVVAQSPFLLGWAKPVPYNPYNLRDQRYGDLKVALAGPATNFAIAFVFGLVLRFFGDAATPAMIVLLDTIVVINIVLGVFNMIPIPPLDGSKVLFSFLPFRFRYIGEYLERYQLIFFIIFILVIWPLLSPVIYFLHALATGFGL